MLVSIMIYVILQLTILFNKFNKYFIPTFTILVTMSTYFIFSIGSMNIQLTWDLVSIIQALKCMDKVNFYTFGFK